MPFVDLPDAALFWRLEGPDGAPPLVLLNSIGTDMALWDPVLPGLREHFCLLRLDARGHGASRAAAGDLSLAMLAGDVLAAADAAGLDRFAVAGVSLGGMVALQLAIDRPDRITALLPICTSAQMDAAAWADRVATVRAGGMEAIADLAMGRFLGEEYRRASPGGYATVRRQLLAMPAEAYAGCGAAIRDMRLSDGLASIRCPTLVISGTRDISTPFEGHGARIVAAIAGARHAALDSAHLAPIEAPDALAAAILAFLGAPPGRGDALA